MKRLDDFNVWQRKESEQLHSMRQNPVIRGLVERPEDSKEGPRRNSFTSTTETVAETLHPHRLRLGRQQLAQHVLQNAAIGVVERFLWRIDAHDGIEFD